MAWSCRGSGAQKPGQGWAGFREILGEGKESPGTTQGPLRAQTGTLFLAKSMETDFKEMNLC